ncbi:alpha/beta fold hydrolase [Tsukamurella sp. 8F]|uniref:alpha/beta fold hydrolase n=1 Tax=unclassified Tsukamurella TaxID=2633480 RepID=UPI0023B962E6|nr:MULTISPECIES: alpha/beta fold hydrolase [unclassified Tsukamurella]MDF0528387.1 alpha/beta fold hydrolase [Tsukamurella sp. 8J]MDF0586212.1 alpha/beta fold hydrolase [Tsukamurella sp. 8F]
MDTKRLTWDMGGTRLAGEETGDGPALLLLHAGGENRTVWRDCAKRLADMGFRSVAVDQRGHGESDARDAHDLAVLGRDVAALLATFDVPPVVVGASLGGFTALHALADPAVRARCSGLVLVDVVPTPAARDVYAFLGPRGLAGDPLVDEMLSRRGELEAAARSLDLPVHLVRAGDGALSGGSVADAAAMIGGLVVHELPGAEHLVARTAPAALTDVLAFVADDDDVRRRRIAAVLRACGAEDAEHPGGTLASHLLRTGERLRQWGSEAWLVDAGCLHAAYGTEGFPTALPGVTPEVVRAAVGVRAAGLIDLYCHCRRADSYATFAGPHPVVVDHRTGERHPLGRMTLRAFVELTVANEMDVLIHSAELRRKYGAGLAALFVDWRGLVGERARAAVDAWPGAVDAVSSAAATGD